jgi:hypothetical protein
VEAPGIEPGLGNGDPRRFTAKHGDAWASEDPSISTGKHGVDANDAARHTGARLIAFAVEGLEIQSDAEPDAHDRLTSLFRRAYAEGAALLGNGGSVKETPAVNAATEGE